MAKFDGKHLRGLLGKLIFKKTKRGGVISTKAKKVRQTAETKKSANFFGQVATFSRVLRTAVKPVGYQDTGLMNRLNKELLSILLQCYDKQTKTFNFSNPYFSRLEGVNFNINSLLQENFLDLPTYAKKDDQLKIAVPEINALKSLKFPKDADFCELYIQPIQIDLNGGHIKSMEAIRTEISQRQAPISAQEFTVKLFPGTLCLISIGVQYFKRKDGRYVEMNDIDFSPAAFSFAAFQEGTFAEVLMEHPPLEFDEAEQKHKIVHWRNVYRGFPISKLPVE